ncbi:MAG: hypothetical protein JST35_00325 [Armatimonadetes bacterium]|nr:hypothetical protein [Armatimonadota bacterium]
MNEHDQEREAQKIQDCKVSESQLDSARPNELLEAYRGLRHDSLVVARQAAEFQLHGGNRLKRFVDSFNPPDSIQELLTKQLHQAEILSGLAKPLPSGFAEAFAKIAEVNGMAGVIEEAMRPGPSFRAMMSELAMPMPKPPGMSNAQMESFRRLAFVNVLDTTVCNMLAAISKHQWAIDSMLSGWRNQFWEEIKQTSHLFARLNAATDSSNIIQLGSLGRFNSVRLLQATLSKEVDDFTQDTVQTVELVRVEVLDTIELALHSVDPRLVKLWRGAKQVLSSENPDRSRHLAVSLRELITSLLHTLAPDRVVQEWSTSSDHYSNGRPTRKARILCIYSRYGHEVQRFFEQDVSSAIEWIQVINAQTHSLDGFETDEAREALLARFEGIALSLIRGAKGFEEVST